MNSQPQTPAAFTPGEETTIPLNRNLGGPQSRRGCDGEGGALSPGDIRTPERPVAA